MNTGLKTFEFEQEFKDIDELYQFLIENVDFIENRIGIRIGEKGLSARPFCIIGREKITERQIMFFASESFFPDSIGEMIILAGAFKADIVVFIVEKINRTILEPINWLADALNEDTVLILSEARIVQTKN